MPLIAHKPADGGDYEKTPEGNHVARCYSVIDLGEHEQVWQSESKGYKRRVRIAFELPLELMQDGRPFSASKEYVLSLHEKASLRKDLESWRGRSFTETELAGFDILKLLGVPCMINVLHQLNEHNGKTYANITAITPLPKGFEVPPQVNKTVQFSLDDATDAEFDALPDYVQKRINRKKPGSNVPADVHAVLDNEILDDDIPF